MNKGMMLVVAVAVAALGTGCGASASRVEVVDATNLRSLPSIAIAERVETIMPGEYEVSLHSQAQTDAKPAASPMGLSHEVASKRGVLMYGSVGGVGVTE